TGQSLPVFRVCARILFIPLSAPPHKLETELGRQLCRGHSAELFLLKRKTPTGRDTACRLLPLYRCDSKNWPVISDFWTTMILVRLLRPRHVLRSLSCSGASKDSADFSDDRHSAKFSWLRVRQKARRRSYRHRRSRWHGAHDPLTQS